LNTEIPVKLNDGAWLQQVQDTSSIFVKAKQEDDRLIMDKILLLLSIFIDLHDLAP
jgi:hypothetical protein